MRGGVAKDIEELGLFIKSEMTKRLYFRERETESKNEIER